VKRSFLVPVGLALAALAPQGGLGQPTAPTEAAVLGDTRGTRGLLAGRLFQPLLAVAGYAGRHLANPMGHVSHSSHASHASHASHFSATPAPVPLPVPAPTPVPPATVTTGLVAVLGTGQEVPVPVNTGRGASGRFTATLSGRILSWRLTFSNLSGQAVSAVIHGGSRGRIGPRIATVCGPCMSPATGTVVLTASQVTQMLVGGTYLNVATRANPTGEIRGQIGSA